jgi:AAA ATPase domain
LAVLDIAAPFKNPFRPGAGHMPPYLAGREEEQRELERLLEQDVILENMVLTGLRGVGKTVLLDTFKPIAISRDWLWVGTDLSESTSVTEQNLAIRLLADLAVVSSSLVFTTREARQVGFAKDVVRHPVALDFPNLMYLYERTPGLVADKVKHVLEFVWEQMRHTGKRGLVFAYDEAQNLADYPAKDHYPLSLLLDVFQSIQKKGIPFMLVLTGLPTLFPKLVEARTFAERMFRVVTLSKLSREDSADAIVRPIQAANCPVRFDDSSVDTICEHSGGYPYFIQFICRELYDVFIQQASSGKVRGVPMEAITRKLDTDFFAGRWARATDRQRELLVVMARLGKSEGEFTVQEIVAKSAETLPKGFSSSHANQMLASLCEAGLVYKNRHGRYSFAVPLFDRFIERQGEQEL